VRLDRVVAMLVGELGQYRGWWSSSAAMKAAALLRISFAERSPVTSLFNSRISPISSLVLPGRTPPSTAARRTQWRSVSVDPSPSWPAITQIASKSLPELMPALRGTCHDLILQSMKSPDIRVYCSDR
jgi:hypothetical protein